MYKLNLTEIELRKQAIDETKDNVVHTKNNVTIDNNVKNDQHSLKGSYSKEQSNKKLPKRYVTVDAVKSNKIRIDAKRESSAYEANNVSGTFVNKLK